MRYGKTLLLIIGLTAIIAGCREPITITSANDEVDIQQWYDHMNHVICYWMTENHGTFTCVNTDE